MSHTMATHLFCRLLGRCKEFMELGLERGGQPLKSLVVQPASGLLLAMEVAEVEVHFLFPHLCP